MLRKMVFAITLCFSIFCNISYAQDCPPPAIVANAKSANLFSPEQEMVFGELALQRMSGEMRFVHNEKLLAYVNEIGARLTKHLPPTGLRFQFHIVDIPEANAFNIPGGHIILSRKLIGFVNNEDELVGVIAHELGHAVVRHGATDISEAFRKVLNVTSFGDRKDITDKYNLLIERARTKRVSSRRGHENDQQLEADKIGLFAMVAAGYDPAAFTSFFDRLTETEGKTGSWFSDLFGNTKPAQKRLREMIRATEQLPPACRDGRTAKASDDFLTWQADVVSLRETGRKEELPGLVWKKELAPKLRTDVSHLTFSPDGKFLLAQDDFSVTVIERDLLQVSFQIPVEGATEATFTPDSKFVIFTTEDMRYEKWSVAEKKPVEVRELVLRRNCWEHRLSPDGNYLACVDTSANVNILEIKTGKKVWEKKEFYRLSAFEFFSWLLSDKGGDRRTNFFRIEYSPDSRYVMFSRSERFRFRIRIDGLTAAGSENTALALDLTTLKPADIGGDVKKISSRPYLFLDSGKILGMPSNKKEDAGVFSFPNGKRMQKFDLLAHDIKRTSNPDIIIIKPLSNMRMGVYDMSKRVIASALDKADATAWNNLLAYESVSGKILLREAHYNEAEKKLDVKDIGSIDIPVSSISNLDAAEVSDSFKWLLFSSKTRGGLWNLETGERKFYVRGFNGGLVADDGGALGDFPRQGEMQHSLVLLNPNNNTINPYRPLPERGAKQYGRFVLLRRSLKDKSEGSGPPAPDDDDEESFSLRQEVRFELRDIIKDKVIWSGEFPKEAPEYSFDDFSGRLVFYWNLGSEAGKAKLKANAELQAKAQALGNKDDDYLVEIIDAFAQKPVSMFLLETGKGSFDVGEGLSEGDWLVLRDSEGRVLVYSIKDGELRHRFFGKTAAISPARNQIAVENFPGEVSLYNLDTGDRHANFVINGSAAFVRFNLQSNKLFVLSDTQSAYVFDLTKLGPAK